VGGGEENKVLEGGVGHTGSGGGLKCWRGF